MQGPQGRVFVLEQVLATRLGGFLTSFIDDPA